MYVKAVEIQPPLQLFSEQPHPTSPIREEHYFTEGSSDRRRNEEEVVKKR